MRWLLFEQMESSISYPLLTIMVFWLALTFLSAGLFAPANGTVITAQATAALAVAGAIFLILELDHPFDGFVRISSEPMLNALKQLML
jgi:nitric oxide reductase large subunit